MNDLKLLLDHKRTIAKELGQSRKYSSFYPSSARIEYTCPDTGLVEVAGTCMRQQWYTLKGYPTPEADNPRFNRIRELGDIIHEMFFRDAMHAKIHEAHEVQFYIEEENISGRIDLMVKDPINNDRIIIEIKTIGGYYKCKGPIFSTKDTPLAPILEHLLQVLVYAHHYRKHGVEKYVLLYCNRENMEYTTHNITFDDDDVIRITNDDGSFRMEHITIEGVLNSYRELDNHLKNDTLPDRDYTLAWQNDKIIAYYNANKYTNKTDPKKIEDALKAKTPHTVNDPPIIAKSDWQCTYCDFAEECWSDKTTQVTTPDIENFA